MGIEAIGSIGTALGSVATAAGKGAAPVAADLAKFGPELKGVYLPTVINEGPVAPKFLENTMPIAIGKLNPVVAKPMVMPRIEPMAVPWILPKVRPALEIQPKSHPVIETRAVNQPTQAIRPALEEQEVKELVEEKQEVKDSKESMEEEEVMESFLYIEDKEVSMERRHEIRQAIIKARVETERLGLKKIAGALVAKFLPVEHEGVRSQVVKEKGPDGSYEETIEAIAGTGELESEEEAVRRFDLVVAEKKPVKNGKEGIPVEIRDIARVFKYRFLKPVQAHVEVINRVKKKGVLVPRQTVLSLDPIPAGIRA